MIDNIQWQTAIEYEAILLYCCILSLLFYLMITFVYLVGGAYILTTSFWLGNFFIIIGTWAATIPVHSQLQQNRSQCLQWGDALKWSFALYYLIFFTFFFYDWTTKELISLVSTWGKVSWIVLGNLFFFFAYLSFHTMRDVFNALYPEYEACCELFCKILKLWIAAFMTFCFVLFDGLVPVLGVTEEEIAEAIDIYSEELSSEDCVTVKYFRAQNTVKDFAHYGSSLVIGMLIGLAVILKIFYVDVLIFSLLDSVQVQLSKKDSLIITCLIVLFLVGIFLGTWRSFYDSVYLELAITVTLSLFVIIFMGLYFSSRDVLRAIQKKNSRDDVSERMLVPSDERIRALAEQTKQEKDENNRKVDDSVPETTYDQVRPVRKGKTLVNSLNTAIMGLHKGECKISLKEDTEVQVRPGEN